MQVLPQDKLARIHNEMASKEDEILWDVYFYIQTKPFEMKTNSMRSQVWIA